MKFFVTCIFIFLLSAIHAGAQGFHETPDKNSPWQRMDNLRGDSLYEYYAWEVHTEYHGASGKLLLYRNGRYKYREFYPFAPEDSSEGFYLIKKNILTINSDFQPGNFPAAINYKDAAQSGTIIHNIYFPVNKNGDTCFDCSYRFNNDSTEYYPREIQKGAMPKEIHSLQVLFAGNQFTSGWIPVDAGGKMIEVLLLTDKNIDNYRYKLFTDYTFRIKKNRLIDLTGK